MELVNWKNVEYFKELKNRPDILGVNPDLIYKLDTFRDILNKSIIVSPVDGAIVAKDGHSPNSFHYKGEAIDVFPKCNPFLVLGALLRYNPFGGIGFYFDTYLGNTKTMMCHFDIRKTDQIIIWFRSNKVYYYLSSFENKEDFWINLISNMQIII